MRDAAWPVFTYPFLRSRRLLGGYAIVLILCSLVLLFGLQDAPLPTVTTGNGVEVRLPLWRLLATGIGIVPGLCLTSKLADLEVSATARLQTASVVLCLINVVLTAVSYLLVCAVILPAVQLPTVARSVFVWQALALTSALTLGARLSWVLPLTGLAGLQFFGFGDRDYRWFEFTARPIDDWRTNALSATVFIVLAVVVGASSPWRVPLTLRKVRRRLVSRPRRLFHRGGAISSAK